jgi:Zn-dependent protease with chaperone function
VKQWSGTSNISSEAESLVMSSAKGAPALLLVGIRDSRVLVSEAAAGVLTPDELQVAIRHELGHKRSWDNLKKLLINATPFPGMSSLEIAWREAAELAADDAAVQSRQDALDLATALIKLSRNANRPVEPALASGLLCNSSLISQRVERLLEWRTDRLRRRWPWALPVLLAIMAGVGSNYGMILAQTHRLTELLVP